MIGKGPESPQEGTLVVTTSGTSSREGIVMARPEQFLVTERHLKGLLVVVTRVLIRSVKCGSA